MSSDRLTQTSQYSHSCRALGGPCFQLGMVPLGIPEAPFDEWALQVVPFFMFWSLFGGQKKHGILKIRTPHQTQCDPSKNACCLKHVFSRIRFSSKAKCTRQKMSKITMGSRCVLLRFETQAAGYPVPMRLWLEKIDAHR